MLLVSFFWLFLLAIWMGVRGGRGEEGNELRRDVKADEEAK